MGPQHNDLLYLKKVIEELGKSDNSRLDKSLLILPMRLNVAKYV
jgi:hypothetical protein